MRGVFVQWLVRACVVSFYIAAMACCALLRFEGPKTALWLAFLAVFVAANLDVYAP